MSWIRNTGPDYATFYITSQFCCVIKCFIFYVPVPEGDAAALAGGAQEGGAQPAVPHTRHSLAQRLCRFKGSSHLRAQNRKCVLGKPY